MSETKKFTKKEILEIAKAQKEFILFTFWGVILYAVIGTPLILFGMATNTSFYTILIFFIANLVFVVKYIIVIRRLAWSIKENFGNYLLIYVLFWIVAYGLLIHKSNLILGKAGLAPGFFGVNAQKLKRYFYGKKKKT